MIEYSIVIPTYNEAANITISLTQVINFMRSYGPSFEVIVVDDGSEDSTVEKVERYVEDHSEVRLIKNPHRGKAYVVKTGIMGVEGRYVCMADADMATPIEELKRLMVWIKDNNFDIAIASREGIGARRKGEPFYRHLMGRVFNYWVRLLTVPNIQDTQCGFKVFKSNVAKEIFGSLKVYGEEERVMNRAYTGAFDVEVLYIARKKGYKVREVPVTWTYVVTKRVHPIKDSIDMAWDVLKIRLNDFKGVYK